MKIRTDLHLVALGHFDSREKAKRAIMAGQVFINGQKAYKGGTLIDPEATRIEIRGDRLKYVGRGGLKLEKAVRAFHLDLKGKTAADIGASTGGFTDCMLQNGARKVYAMDVGYGQLDWKLRKDPRVVVMERTNVRYLDPATIPDTIDFISIDVSFISLKLILPVAYRLLKQEGELVCLLKPQFEAGREKVGKNGVVRDRSVHKEVIMELLAHLKGYPFTLVDMAPSPITGAKGNIEFLVYCRKSIPDPSFEPDFNALAEHLLDELNP